MTSVLLISAVKHTGAVNNHSPSENKMKDMFYKGLAAVLFSALFFAVAFFVEEYAGEKEAPSDESDSTAVDDSTPLPVVRAD